MSVFLSWSGADREVKNAIAERLKQEGIPFWESDEGCISDFSAECIANVKRSSVFVVIISQASMDQHSYVFNEVIAAREMENDGKLNILVYRITDQPYTDRFAMQLNHVTDTNHIYRKRNLGALGGVDQLTKRIKYLLQCRAEGRAEKPFDVHHPDVAGFKLNGSIGGYFVPDSRNDVIAQIEQGFTRSNVIILTELFGFGKKSAIRKYIATHNYSTAVEVQSAHESLYGFFLNTLCFTNVNDGAFAQSDEKSIIQKKFDFLKKLGKDEILVISNLDIEDQPDMFVLNLLNSLSCHVAIITQKVPNVYADYLPVISVGRMETEHLTELFFHHYDREGKIDRAQFTPALLGYFEDIGGHTQTVEITASVLESKMKTNTLQVIEYLSRKSDGERALMEKIVDRLSELIEIKQFTTSEQSVLLVISLVANPTVNTTFLQSILEHLDIYDEIILSSLHSNRWITLDKYNDTVFIEPIIAKIFVSKFIDYFIAKQCFEYLGRIQKNYVNSDGFTVIQYYNRLENFLRLLDLNKPADIIRGFKTYIIDTNNNPSELEITAYTDWYQANVIEGTSLSDKEQFVASVITWTNAYVLPGLKLSSLRPVLTNIGSGAVSHEVMNDMMGDIFDGLIDIAENDTFQDALTTFIDDNESEFKPIIDVCNDITQLFVTKDTAKMFKMMDDLINNLEDHPEYLADDDVSTSVISVIKLMHGVCSNSKSYNAGIAMLERIIPLGWTNQQLHLLLLMDITLQLLADEPADAVLSLMENADQLLQEIANSGAINKDQLLNITREHTHVYTQVLVVNNLSDRAIAKFDELTALGVLDFSATIVSLMDSIVDLLFVEGRTTDAIAFIADNRNVIVKCLKAVPEDSNEMEVGESLLTMLDFNGAGQVNIFEEGGETISESYYQKYSSQKGNNLLQMMPYNRVADGVKRFDFSHLTDSQLAEKANDLRARAKSGENKMRLAPEAFALVSEAGYRVLGYRHHKVQYVGGAVMLDGKIAEILNGEGKTYTIVLTAFVNSLYSQKVFILDSSEYLSKRNYKWMRGVYSLLGLKVGLITGENGSNDTEVVNCSNIIYSSFVKYGFHLLRAELNDGIDKVKDLLANCSAIIDEADSILVENAKAPLMLAQNQSHNKPEELLKFRKVFDFAKSIYGDKNYYKKYPNSAIELKKPTQSWIESTFNVDSESFADSPEFVHISRLIRCALYAFSLVSERDFFVRNNIIYNEQQGTGTLAPINNEIGYFVARFNNLSPAIVGAYGNKISIQVPYSNITYTYELLKRIGNLSGTSATACSFKKAFKDVYKLEVIAIPTVLPVQRVDKTVGLFVDIASKQKAIVDMVANKHATGQPVLLVVKNIHESTVYSKILTQRGIKHKVLNATNADSSPEMLSNAGLYGSVLVATQLANRGVDIKLGGDAERMTLVDLEKSGMDTSQLDNILYTSPDEQTKQSELYRTYSALLAKNRMITSANRDKVLSVGGLCVISTEPTLDMRMEQQIRGRAGRQGAVGESYVFECLDDDAVIIVDRVKDYFRKMVYESGLEVVSSSLLTNSIEKARKLIHQKSFNSIKDSLGCSDRIDKTKSEFFRFIFDAKRNDSINTLEELLEIWSTLDENVDIVYEVVDNPCFDEDCWIAKLVERYGEDAYAKSADHDCSKYLVALAKCLLADPALEQLKVRNLAKTLTGEQARSLILVKYLWLHLAKHLTQMYAVESDFTSNQKKNSKILGKLYQSDRNLSLANAVNDWLFELM